MHQLFQFEFQHGKNKHIGYYIGGHPVRGMTFFVQGEQAQSEERVWSMEMVPSFHNFFSSSYTDLQERKEEDEEGRA